MTESDSVKYIRRCLDLAIKAEGMTYPNPMVGSVIVHEGNIIGEGYHLKAGGPHAEVIAINSVADHIKLRDSTIYVSLEPCSHYGKTPPCADFIISKSIPRVVIGSTDPNEKVAGKGIAKLRNAGCEVTVGVLEADCRRLNKRFFTFHEKKRPYIILKWAQSADGFLDVTRSGDDDARPTWITGKPERSLVHKWRSEEQSILAGGATVRADNPKLNVREWTGRDPLRLILSSSGNIPDNAAVFSEGGRTILFTNNSGYANASAEVVLTDDSMPSCFQVVRYLYEMEIQSLFIEGGAAVLNHFISNGLWDEARIFTGDIYFKNGVKAPELSGLLTDRMNFSRSILEVYLNH